MVDLTKGVSKSYRAGNLLISARAAYERANGVHAESETSILLSAIAVEAYLNEIPDYLQMLGGTRLAALGNLLEAAESENASLKLKLHTLHYGLAGTAPDWGSRPFQDLNLLVAIRNRIVHTKPVRVTFEAGPDGQDKLVNQLITRKVIPKPSDLAVDNWPQFVLTKPVAAWAYNTALTSLKAIGKIAQEPVLKQLFQMLFGSHQPIEPEVVP